MTPTGQGLMDTWWWVGVAPTGRSLVDTWWWVGVASRWGQVGMAWIVGGSGWSCVIRDWRVTRRGGSSRGEVRLGRRGLVGSVR